MARQSIYVSQTILRAMSDPRSNIRAIILMKFLGTHRGLRISILYKKKNGSAFHAARCGEYPTMPIFYFSSVRFRNAVKVALARKKKTQYPETENSAR